MHWDETGGWTRELIDADDLARLSCRFNGYMIFGSLMLPWSAMGFTVSASRAHWCVNVGKFPRYQTCFGKEFERGKS